MRILHKTAFAVSSHVARNVVENVVIHGVFCGVCAWHFTAVIGRVFRHEDILAIDIVHSLQLRQDEGRCYDIQQHHTEQDRNSAIVHDAQQSRAVVEPAQFHLAHALVDAVETRPNDAVAHDLVAHVSVVRHFVEKVVVLTVLKQPFFAGCALNKRNVGHVEIVDAADDKDRDPRHRDNGAGVFENL